MTRRFASIKPDGLNMGGEFDLNLYSTLDDYQYPVSVVSKNYSVIL